MSEVDDLLYELRDLTLKAIERNQARDYRATAKLLQQIYDELTLHADEPDDA